MQNAEENPTKKEKYEQKIKQLRAQIKEEAKTYRELSKEVLEGDVKCAYVTFRSMEGAARFINAYQMRPLSRLILKLRCCFCFDTNQYNEKLFHGRWLFVSEAIDPALIMWENLGISQKARCCRILFKTIISAILVMMTTAFILYVKIYESNLNASQVTCDDNVQFTRKEAYRDQLDQEDGVLSNIMACYCR